MVPSTESSTVGDGCSPTRSGILTAVPSRGGRRPGSAVPRRDAWWRPGAALGSASGPQLCGRSLPAAPRVRRSGGDACKPSLSEEGSGREGATLAAPPRSVAAGLGPPVTLGGGRRGPHFRAGATETGWGLGRPGRCHAWGCGDRSVPPSPLPGGGPGSGGGCWQARGGTNWAV